MTSYEIVRRAVEFDSPERIPIRFGALGIDDTFGVGLQAAAGWQPSQPQEDEWGVVWTPAPEGVTNMGQPKGHNLASLDRLDEVKWPDPHDDNRFAAIEGQLQNAGEKYVMVGCGFTFFERMHYLYGMPELFIALYENPKGVHELAGRVIAFPIGIAEEIGRRFRGRVHGFAMTDDWGTQEAAFTSLPMFREFFKPYYRRLFDAIHDAGMHAWMHSCGHVNDIVEEWIDCGLDLVNLQQPTNRRLLWESSPQPTIDGKSFRIFPTQNPCQLRSGRVLAPVTLIGPASADAPEGVTGWWATEKRDSVLYTDDGGETWRASPGAMLPQARWAQWEPTVWQTADGAVMMLARNNDFRPSGSGGPRPTEALLWSVSRDGGETWTPHEFVALETVVSRMHVLPLAGDRFVMVHNDWPAGQFVHDRRNLALFLKRGAGFDFTAGLGISGTEPFVMYPMMWVHGDELLVSYSQGNMPRSIEVARVSPLPDPGKHYLLPRSNLPRPPAPERIEEGLAFHGGQYVESRQALDPGEEGFSAGAWVRPRDGGALLDSRFADRAGGVLWGLSRQEGSIRPYVFLGTQERNLMSDLALPSNRWSYVGLTVDRASASVRFRVNGESQQVSYTPPSAPFAGATAYIGHKRFERSQVPALEGDLGWLVVYAGPALTDEDHAHLAASGLGEAPTPVLALRPQDTTALERDFVLPSDRAGAAEVAEGERGPVLRLAGEGSAGVELDENDRARDVVRLRFRFRIDSGDEQVLCTVGDARQPARLAAKGGELALEAGEQRVEVGRVRVGEWAEAELATFGDRTEARAAKGAMAGVTHAPQATWVYLGEGYGRGRIGPEAAFTVDVTGVCSQVETRG